MSLGERKHKHWLNSKNPDKNKKQAFYLAISKYGWENFEWQELCCALSKEDLSELEKQFIEEYDTYQNGYNNTLGREGVLNPRKMERYVIRFPDNTIHIVTGWQKFCRKYNVNGGNLYHTLKPYKRTYTYKSKKGNKYYTYWMKAKSCKGYVLLGKFNDYLGTEYLQAEGSGGLQAD